MILDKYGKPFGNKKPLKQQAFGRYSSIYEYPNVGRYRWRMYVNQDTEVDSNFIVRDLQVRWSREMNAQMAFVNAAVKAKAYFCIGDEYKSFYKGQHSAWGREVIQWQHEILYPNICKRGRSIDFQTMMFIQSLLLDIDGDVGQLHGEKDGLAKVQMIPCHRIFNKAQVQLAQNYDLNNGPEQGPWPNTVMSDGVVYGTEDGEPLAYSVINPNNMVTSTNGEPVTQLFSARDMRLIYDPEYADRGRGFPSISAGLLQCMSLQEIQQYMNEKIKIQSLIAVVEKNDDGLAPYEEARAYQEAMNADVTGVESSLKGMSAVTDNHYAADKSLRIVNDPAIRYATADGDVKPLGSQTGDEQTMQYITNQEAQVLQTIGIPHALLFSHDAVSGRISDGVVDIFNRTISHRQSILDKNAQFILAWATAKAIKNGDLPPQPEDGNGEVENLTRVFGLTHPPQMNLNKSYDRNDNLKEYKAGTRLLQDCINVPVDEFYDAKDKEVVRKVKGAQIIAKETGIKFELAMQLYDKPDESAEMAKQSEVETHENN